MNANCYIAKRLNGAWAGVSLGRYIIFSNDVHLSLDALKHEYGHTLQSKKLGWLYLIVIGLPSFIGNLYDRVAHRNWSSTARYKWYYEDKLQYKSEIPNR